MEKIKKGKIKKEIIKKKIEEINKNYKYRLEFKALRKKDLILKYEILFLTSSNYIIAAKGFRTLDDVYIYIKGFTDALEV